MNKRFSKNKNNIISAKPEKYYSNKVQPYYKKLKMNVEGSVLLWNNHDSLWVNLECVDPKCALDLCNKVSCVKVEGLITFLFYVLNLYI